MPKNFHSMNIGTILRFITAAGPQSFQKGALLGQKAALNLWYIDTWGQIRKNCSRAFEGLSYLA